MKFKLMKFKLVPCPLNLTSFIPWLWITFVIRIQALFKITATFFAFTITLLAHSIAFLFASTLEIFVDWNAFK